MLLKGLALSVSLFAFSFVTHSQQTSPVLATKDSQAVTVLQQCVSAMSVAPPADSTANGIIETFVGSQTTSGTVRILTKGTAESSVQITTSGNTDTLTYSNNQASESVAGAITVLSLERTQTTQSVEFPQPLVLEILNDPDTTLQYVGIESLNGQTTNHVRSVDTYASQPTVQQVSNFSTRDIWLDTSTGLPARISFMRRSAQGASAGVAVDVFFSNYQSFQGVLYPMTIQESLNGTPWATITIQTVSFNSGLTDASFSIQTQGVNQ